MWPRTACKISGSLSFLKWNAFFYHISELMLPTLSQIYDENHFIFDSVQKRETNWIFTSCQMPHFIYYINLLNFSWIKMCIFEGYGAFNCLAFLFSILRVQSFLFFCFFYLVVYFYFLRFSCFWSYNHSKFTRSLRQGSFIGLWFWLLLVIFNS